MAWPVSNSQLAVLMVHLWDCDKLQATVVSQQLVGWPVTLQELTETAVNTGPQASAAQQSLG